MSHYKEEDEKADKFINRDWNWWRRISKSSMYGSRFISRKKTRSWNQREREKK